MNSKFTKTTIPIRILWSLILGIITSWLSKDGVTWLILNGKSFSGRSFLIKIGILAILVIFTSAFFFLFLPILNSFYARNEKLQQLVKKISNLFYALNHKLQQLVKKIIFSKNGRMTIDKKLGLLCLIIVTGFFCAVAFHYYMGVYLGQPYPHNTFLFRPDDRFNDFFNPLRGSFDRDPYNPERISFIGGYFPFGYMLSFLFSLIHPRETSFLLFIGSFLVFLLVFIGHSLYDGKGSLDNRKLLVIFCLAFMTYPVLMIIDRANFDISIFIFITLFAFFYQKGKFTISAILLAPAIAMKGYPVILMTLFLMDRRFKEFVLSGVLVILLTFGSLALFKDGLVLEFQKMLASFGQAFSIAFEGGSLIRFNSSMFIFLLMLLQPLFPNIVTSPLFNSLYIILSLLVFILATLLMYIRKYPFWRKLLAFITLMILLPQSSADYRLLMLYVPLMLYLRTSEQLESDKLMVIVLGLLLIPKSYLVLFSDVNIGIILNPLLLVVLFILTLSSHEEKAKLEGQTLSHQSVT